MVALCVLLAGVEELVARGECSLPFPFVSEPLQADFQGNWSLGYTPGQPLEVSPLSCAIWRA